MSVLDVVAAALVVLASAKAIEVGMHLWVLTRPNHEAELLGIMTGHQDVQRKSQQETIEYRKGHDADHAGIRSLLHRHAPPPPVEPSHPS